MYGYVEFPDNGSRNGGWFHIVLVRFNEVVSPFELVNWSCCSFLPLSVRTHGLVHLTVNVTLSGLDDMAQLALCILEFL